MKSVKQSSMSAVNQRRGAEGELWQPRFFDCALRSVKEYNEKVEYIHLDPVRAGLVSRPEDWSRPAGSSYNECAGMSADESVSRRTVRSSTAWECPPIRAHEFDRSIAGPKRRGLAAASGPRYRPLGNTRSMQPIFGERPRQGRRSRAPRETQTAPPALSPQHGSIPGSAGCALQSS